MSVIVINVDIVEHIYFIHLLCTMIRRMAVVCPEGVLLGNDMMLIFFFFLMLIFFKHPVKMKSFSKFPDPSCPFPYLKRNLMVTMDV